MNTLLRNSLLIATTILLCACSDNAEQDRLKNVGQGDDESDKILADSLFCTGTASVLSEVSVDNYPSLTSMNRTFNKIAKNAGKKADSLRGNDGAAIDTRLTVIKRQTEQNVKTFDTNDSEKKLSEFVEEVLTKCNEFTLPE